MIKLKDNDYILEEKAAWVELNGKSIRIFEDPFVHGSVVVEVYDIGKENEDPLDQIMVV